MNLLASYKWIKEYVKTNLSPEEFAARLSLCGPSIERIYPQGENLEKVLVGQILKIKPHPNADKLRIVETDLGKGKILEIVCGGSNLKEGMKVAVALVGAKVKWHGEGELIELKPAEIRGVKSEGMICGANEIGLFEYFPHAEREIMDLSNLDVLPGTPVREALDLDDVVFDIEVTTNRPDAFSMVGLAREAGAILGAPFLWKETKSKLGVLKSKMPLDIKIAAPKLCPRYQAAVLTNVQVKPSPWWLQRRLLAAGIRPICNIVDITNYVMLELGQPMHVFDADRLVKDKDGLKINVRLAAEGETMKALDGQTYNLKSSMLVIADAKRPVAIAGVMGGEETGVTRDTTTIIFESATFDPVSVRRMARALNLHSDSSLRFEKGLSSEATTTALARAVQLAQELAGATVASALLDRRVAPYRNQVFAWDPKETIKLIGVSIPVPRLKQILESLGFKVGGKGKTYRVTVPFWRDHDIESSRDLTEEVARVYGYHLLPSVIPGGELPARPTTADFIWEERLRELLRGAGLTEVYTYSFISEQQLDRSLMKMIPAVKLQNPLTADFVLMRPSLIPSFLQVATDNQHIAVNGSVFEVSNIYLPRAGNLPEERLTAAALFWGESPEGELFFKIKGLLELLSKATRVPIELEEGSSTQLHPGRQLSILIDGKEIGILGEMHPLILEKFGIKHRVALFQFDVMSFAKASKTISVEPIPLAPPSRRDISFLVLDKTGYFEIVETMRASEPLLREVELFDIYKGQGVPEGKKSLAFHLTFAQATQTLTGELIDQAFLRIKQALQTKLTAEIRTA